MYTDDDNNGMFASLKETYYTAWSQDRGMAMIQENRVARNRGKQCDMLDLYINDKNMPELK